MALIDISQPISSATAVWPGDTQFSAHRVMDMASGASVNVGTVTMSVHTGTHADAPAHYVDGDLGIGEVPLEAYLGPAWVTETAPRGAVSIADIREACARRIERLLIKTGTAPDPCRFNTDFAWLSEEAAAYLRDRGLKLVGIDTPSMDAFDSKLLPTHKLLRSAGVAILENLDLSNVEPGAYELIALPLRLQGLDASPVRAILRNLPEPPGRDADP